MFKNFFSKNTTLNTQVKKMKRLFLIPVAFLSFVSAYAQGEYYSLLKNDTLVVGNELIERKFIWNKGNLITYSLTDKLSDKHWFNKHKSPDFHFSKDTESVSNAVFVSREIAENAI